MRDARLGATKGAGQTGRLSGARFGGPKGAIKKQHQAEGLNRCIRRDRQPPGDLATSRSDQARGVEPRVCVLVRRIIGTVFNMQRLVVVMMVPGILPMHGGMLDLQRPLGNALGAQHGQRLAQECDQQQE